MSTLVCLILFLLKSAVGLVALTVLLSFTVAWYERANSDPDVIERRFTTRGIGLSLWLMIQETACLLITIILRPFGWTTTRLATHIESNKPPVILLHGLFQNRSCLFWLQHRLRRAGYQHVICINTPPWRDLETLTEVLAKKIDETRIALRVEKVCLVGHSMGGIIARNYIQHRGGAPHVEQFVSLASPHHGSKLAPFAVSPMGKSLLPGSGFLRQFNSLPWPEGTRATAIYTRHDNIVLPVENARLAEAMDVELSGMGHTSMLFHPEALNAVVAALEAPSQ